MRHVLGNQCFSFVRWICGLIYCYRYSLFRKINLYCTNCTRKIYLIYHSIVEPANNNASRWLCSFLFPYLLIFAANMLACVLTTIYNVNSDQPVKYSYKHYNIIPHRQRPLCMFIHSPCLVLQSFCFSCELTLLITTSPAAVASLSFPCVKIQNDEIHFSSLRCF